MSLKVNTLTPQTPMSRHHIGSLSQPEISILEIDRERRERREAGKCDFTKVNATTSTTTNKRPLPPLQQQSHILFDESFLSSNNKKRQCIGLSLPLSHSAAATTTVASRSGEEESSSPPSLISCMSPGTSSFSGDDDDDTLGPADLQTPFLHDLDPAFSSSNGSRRHIGSVPKPTLRPRKAFTDRMDDMYGTSEKNKKANLPFFPL